MKPRRKFIQSVGVSGVIGLAGCMSIRENSEGEENPPRPDFDGYIDRVDGGYEDYRGVSEVNVITNAEGNGGNLAFSPAGIWIDPSTTVTWEATGDGGHVGVTSVDGEADFELALTNETGDTVSFEFTEEHTGITKYNGLDGFDYRGAIAVGDSVPTTTEYETN